jgi:hypothetical protein
VNDKVAEAIETLRVELGLHAMTIWRPSRNEDAEVEAIFFAKDDAALMAAAVDYVTGDKPAS